MDNHLKEKNNLDKAYLEILKTYESIQREKEEKEKILMTRKVEELTKNKTIILENSLKRMAF